MWNKLKKSNVCAIIDRAAKPYEECPWQGGSLPSQENRYVSESDGREVVQMTVYEIIMIVLRVIGLLISLGSLLIALLTFLNRKDK